MCEEKCLQKAKKRSDREAAHSMLHLNLFGLQDEEVDGIGLRKHLCNTL